MHTNAAGKRGRLTYLGFDVVDAEMLDGASKTTFKIHAVGHLIHHIGKHADIRQHDVGRTDGGIEDDGIHEIADVVEATE